MENFFVKHANEYFAIWVNVCSLANIDYLKYAKKYGISKRIIHAHNSQNMDSFLRGILLDLIEYLLVDMLLIFGHVQMKLVNGFIQKK